MITVEAICEHGAIGRSTFYTHFKGKDDLKRSAIDHLHAELLGSQTQTGRSPDFAFSRTLFEHAKRHARDYQTLSRGRGARVVLSRIKQIVTPLVRKELLRQCALTSNVRDDRIVELQVIYIVGALIALLTHWLGEGAHIESKEMARLFSQMSQRALTRNDE